MIQTTTRIQLRPMIDADIAQVLDIERQSFPTMWPQTAYKRELTNKIARYLVIARPSEEAAPEASGLTGIWGAVRRAVGATDATLSDDFLMGFIGVWLMVNEAHIVTIATREECRRQGVGERLLIAAIALAQDADQEVVTLEVRASNVSAQAMYEKYAFAKVGLRKHYYTDDREDAVIMTTPDIFVPSYKKLLDGLRDEHRAAHPELWA